jgi:hypothetical protein
MTWLLLCWLLLFVAASLSAGLIETRIIDDLERGLHIEARPSWRGWKIRRIPLAEVRQHRQMYPSSNLRKWWAVISVVQASLLIIPFASAIVGSVMKGG